MDCPLGPEGHVLLPMPTERDPGSSLPEPCANTAILLRASLLCEGAGTGQNWPKHFLDTSGEMEDTMAAPSPEVSNLWLARAFNAQDVDAIAALYHPEAAIVQVDDVHGGTRIARGAEVIRATVAA